MPETIAPPAPKPAAPAPSPAPPPIPTPPPPTPAVPPSSDDTNPFAEIDAAIERVEPSARPPKPEPAASKKDEPKPTPAAAKPLEKKAETPKESFAQLRQRLEQVEGELTTKSKAYTDLEAKIKDFEERGKDTTVLSERLTALERERDRLKGQNRMLRFETSDEFKKGFDEPFNALATEAESIINQIQFQTTNDDGTIANHQADWKRDFASFYRLNRFAAQKEAKKIFGDDGADIALDYYKQLHSLEKRRDDRLAEEQRDWKANVEKEEAESITKREQINTARQAVRKDLAEKHDLYRDPPEDKEASELRSKGYAVFDKEPASEAHRIVKEEATRHIVAAHGPMKLKIARLEAELQKYRDAEKAKNEVPGKTKRSGGGEAAPDDKPWEQALREHVSE